MARTARGSPIGFAAPPFDGCAIVALLPGVGIRGFTPVTKSLPPGHFRIIVTKLALGVALSVRDSCHPEWNAQLDLRNAS